MASKSLPQIKAMTNARRAVIERAVAKAEQPKPVAPGITKGMTNLQIAGHVARTEKNPAVGGMTKLLYALPPEDQEKVRKVAGWYADERELGPHGDKQKVLDAFGLPADLAEAVVNGLEVDQLAAELQRRRGTDANKPLPKLTRRDFIDAAIDVHEPRHIEAGRVIDEYYKSVTDPDAVEGDTPSRRKSVEDAYNFHDRLKDVLQGKTPGE